MGLTVRRRPPLLDVVHVNAIYLRILFVGPGKGVGHEIGLSLYISNVRCIF